MCSCESFFVNLTMITSTIDNTCVSPLLLLLLLLVRRTGRHKTGLLMCEVGGTVALIAFAITDTLKRNYLKEQQFWKLFDREILKLAFFFFFFCLNQDINRTARARGSNREKMGGFVFHSLHPIEHKSKRVVVSSCPAVGLLVPCTTRCCVDAAHEEPGNGEENNKKLQKRSLSWLSVSLCVFFFVGEKRGNKREKFPNEYVWKMHSVSAQDLFHEFSLVQ